MTSRVTERPVALSATTRKLIKRSHGRRAANSASNRVVAPRRGQSPEVRRKKCVLVHGSHRRSRRRISAGRPSPPRSAGGEAGREEGAEANPWLLDCRGGTRYAS